MNYKIQNRGPSTMKLLFCTYCTLGTVFACGAVAQKSASIPDDGGKHFSGTFYGVGEEIWSKESIPGSTLNKSSIVESVVELVLAFDEGNPAQFAVSGIIAYKYQTTNEAVREFIGPLLMYDTRKPYLGALLKVKPVEFEYTVTENSYFSAAKILYTPSILLCESSVCPDSEVHYTISGVINGANSGYIEIYNAWGIRDKIKLVRISDTYYAPPTTPCMATEDGFVCDNSGFDSFRERKY